MVLWAVRRDSAAACSKVCVHCHAQEPVHDTCTAQQTRSHAAVTTRIAGQEVNSLGTQAGFVQWLQVLSRNKGRKDTLAGRPVRVHPISSHKEEMKQVPLENLTTQSAQNEATIFLTQRKYYNKAGGKVHATKTSKVIWALQKHFEAFNIITHRNIIIINIILITHFWGHLPLELLESIWMRAFLRQ